MSGPATRLLAVVFTDVVGSTAARQRLGDRAYAEAILAHHGVLRETLADLGDGTEIETAGDSMLLAFGTPSAAVRFALVARAGLRAWNAGRDVPLADRFAAHLGEVVVHEGRRTELFSLTLDTCARVHALAEADRILVTRAVFDSARQHLAEPGLTWWHHGHYVLHGVDAPVEVCEVAEAADGPRTPPSSVAKARRVAEDEQPAVAGWRPSPGAAVPGTAFVLERSLGEGSVGEAWVARHKVLRDLRVLKFCFGAERLRSLRREVALFRVLQERVGAHPHIVRLHDVRLDEAPCFLVTDYAAGSDLVGWWELRRADPPRLPLRLEIVAQVAEALQAAHDAGVLHRDVKPANVLVEDRAGRTHARLLDFGVGQVMSAELLGGLTQEGLPATVVAGGESTTTSGTRMYLAPELISGGAASPRSDVYALGLVLWQLVVGDLRRALPVDWERSVDDDLLREDLRRCFAGDPAERWQGAADLARSLRTLPERRAARAAEREEAARRAVEEAARLDRERRRAGALALVAEADALLPVVAAERNGAAAFRAEADAHLAGVEPWEPEERKAPGWALAAEGDAAERRAAALELRRETLLAGALTHAGDCEEARTALCAVELARHAAAEAGRDEATAARAAALLRDHVSQLPPLHPVASRMATYLSGDGALTLVTEPDGAAVELHRYELHNRRLAAVPVKTLGRTPLRAVSLQMGSYLCRVRHAERHEVRYPVLVGRGEHWDGVRPGRDDPSPVRLPEAGELGPSDVHVPRGWFVSGGDPEAYDSLPRRRLWCDDLVVRRFPVTNREYLAFLDDLVDTGREEDALRHQPRERASGDGHPVYGRDARGRFVLRPDADGDLWLPDMPVLLVDWFAASAYAAWLAERTGRPWRLPGELEWEKAARGVDGRFHPWGDFLDPSWCRVGTSHAGRPLPAAVDSHPVDESPYGVRGLGGNVQDWCADAYRREGPPLELGRVVPAPPDDAAGAPRARVRRGGNFFGPARNARSAVRFRVEPAFRDEDLGFRVAYRPGP